MKILLKRGGGHGDILCFTSVLPGLKEKYPGCEIDFWAWEKFDLLIQKHPLIHNILNGERTPANNDRAAVKKSILAQYDLKFEPNLEANWNDWICRVFCRLVEVPFSPPTIYLSDEELSEAPESDVTIVSHTISDGRRNYKQIGLVARDLARRHNVIQIDDGPDLGIIRPIMNIRQAACALAKSKIVLTIDTGLMHVASCLRHPQVSLLSITSPNTQYIPNAWIAPHDLPPVIVVDMIERRLADEPPVDGTITTDMEGLMKL